MSSSDGRLAEKRGFSLIEVLVVLSILALTIIVFAVARPGPSPAMRLEEDTGELLNAASVTRTRAIRLSQTQVLELGDRGCADSVSTLTFFADGTAADARICLTRDHLTRWLFLDPLTGQISRVDQS